METAVLTCDWLMTEEEAREKMDAAKTRAERNYYTVVLLLIKARIA